MHDKDNIFNDEQGWKTSLFFFSLNRYFMKPYNMRCNYSKWTCFKQPPTFKGHVYSAP